VYLLEALASGIPVVQPALGAFPEITEISGGGITYSPNNPEALANALAALLADPDQLHDRSRRARAGVERHFNINTQADKWWNIYQRINKNRSVMILEINNLRKGYGVSGSAGYREILSGLDLTVRPGQSIAITGP
jgi:ATPase subunit of ABC transporter with duplicated ATPase domains